MYEKLKGCDCPQYPEKGEHLETCKYFVTRTRAMKAFSRPRKAKPQHPLNENVIPPIVEKALIETYKKHHMGLDNIGWGELGNLLMNALVEIKGHKWFQNFTEQETV